MARSVYRTRRSSSGRVDSNQSIIIEALEMVGCKVIDTSGLGEGYPDLTVIRPDGRVALVEVKTEQGKLKPAQVKFLMWLVPPFYRIFDDPEQAANAVLKWE